MKSKKDKTNLGKKLSKKMKYKWIKALESGRYEQTTGELQDYSGKNCCLGVLCRVMGVKHKTFHNGGALSDFEKLQGIISKDVEDKLVAMNDVDRKSFTEIAEYLRKTNEV